MAEGDLIALRHPRVDSAVQTCNACPEQYEGKLIDGRVFYFRLRSSRATLGVGQSLDEAVRDSWERPWIEHEWDDGGRPGLVGMFDTPQDRDRIFAELLEGIE